MLSDHNKPEPEQFITVSKLNMNELFSDPVHLDLEDSTTYKINRTAFDRIESYQKIYERYCPE